MFAQAPTSPLKEDLRTQHTTAVRYSTNACCSGLSRIQTKQSRRAPLCEMAKAFLIPMRHTTYATGGISMVEAYPQQLQEITLWQ